MDNRQEKIKRIGLLFVGFEEANLPAIHYLLLHLNTLQTNFEFEILPVDDKDRFIRLLSTKNPLDREETRSQVKPFIENHEGTLTNWMKSLVLEDATLPNNYILITLAHFSDGYYTLRQDRLSILAMGDWKKTMAPPSIVEFILTLVIRESVSAISPSLRGSIHYGTKGCLFDFTPYLEYTRYKILNAFICTHCRNLLIKDGLPDLANEIVAILSKEWVGKTSDLSSPAGISSKLGYDLFLTKGLNASNWEKFSYIIK